MSGGGGGGTLWQPPARVPLHTLQNFLFILIFDPNSIALASSADNKLLTNGSSILFFVRDHILLGDSYSSYGLVEIFQSEMTDLTKLWCQFCGFGIQPNTIWTEEQNERFETSYLTLCYLRNSQRCLLSGSQTFRRGVDTKLVDPLHFHRPPIDTRTQIFIAGSRVFHTASKTRINLPPFSEKVVKFNRRFMDD